MMRRSSARTGTLKPQHRYICVGDQSVNEGLQFCNNYVVTSKYTIISFLPKFFFETFRKLSNLYFLLISILQCIPRISNTAGLPSSLPALLFIITVDAMFAILEDRKRHIADQSANARPTCVLDKESEVFAYKPSCDIVVGDLIRLDDQDYAPADIVILAVHSQPDTTTDGICYVETKSLDGETNLKIRNALAITMSSMGNIENLIHLKGAVECEHPNKLINSFKGVLRLENEDVQPIEYENMLLRGCVVRNTRWVHGLVINTGRDTKIMRSMSPVPAKMSTMERSFNVYTIILVLLLIIFSALGATGAMYWRNGNTNAWYLGEIAGPAKNSAEEWIVMLLYYFLLMYQFIPISLSVSMSMVKFIQAQFIQWDIEMYHEETNTPTLVRSMSLNEELGQISYLFTDKTGTLTCNVMEFRKCSIGGITYGYGTTEIGLAAMKRKGLQIPDPIAVEKTSQALTHVNFEGPELFAAMRGEAGETQRQNIEDFFLHLSVCHTVTSEAINGGSEFILSASSPDEQALVAGAAYFGFKFIGRKKGAALVQMHGVVQEIAVLEVLEFTSSRKRMSTIVRHRNGKLQIYTKGADNIIFPRLVQMDASYELQQNTINQIGEYAADGLRTLIIAQKDLDPVYYKAWSRKFRAAQGSMIELDKRKNDHPNEIDSCMDEIESDLQLIGATAIEDKLQEGVPTAIANLAAAGIKTWILTGDKEETAINIGFACQLLTNDLKIITLNLKSCQDSSAMLQKLKMAISTRRAELDMNENASRFLEESKEIALVIDGEALENALGSECRLFFAIFAQYCKAVIACRVSPAQKADLVALIRELVPDAKTLSIGDGANDVPMIQKAHVGVGISGQEGLQAVNASDYAIARFRFLERLLLVHGRWNYKRLSTMVLYIFHKNILLTVSQYWYIFVSAFSGQKIFLETGVQVYNIILTSIPIIILSILDQDIDGKNQLKYPKLYLAGPSDEHLNKRIFVSWIFDAIFQSVVITYASIAAYDKAFDRGQSGTIWVEGNVIFTMIIFVENVKLMLHQHGLYWFSILFYVVSIGSWLIIGYFAGMMPMLADLMWKNTMQLTFTFPSFWVLLLLIPICSLSLSFIANQIKAELYPEYSQLVKEVLRFKTHDNLLEWPGVNLGMASRPDIRKNNTFGSKPGTIFPLGKQLGRAQSSICYYNGFAFSLDERSNETESKLLRKSPAVEYTK